VTQPPQDPEAQPPYGQTPYGQSPYGQAPYGQAPYGQQPYPVGQQDPRPPSKAMAGWALGLSFVSCIGIAWLVSVGLAIAVLVQGRDGRDHGKGLAIAALVVDGVFLLIGFAFVVYALVGGTTVPSTSSEDLAGDEKETVAIEDVSVGDCFNQSDLTGTDGSESVQVEEVELVSCDTPHDLEMYARQHLPGDDYPGDDEAARQSEQICVEEFEAFVGKPYAKSVLGVIYFQPQPRGWELGDHWATCAVGDVNGKPVTGTLRNSRR
jgi:hypothetical protein